MTKKFAILHGRPPSPPSMIKRDPRAAAHFHTNRTGETYEKGDDLKTMVRGSSGRRKQYKKRFRRRKWGVQKGGGHFGIGRVVGAIAKAAVKQIAKKVVKKVSAAAAKQIAKTIASKAAKGAAAAGGAYLTSQALKKMSG